MGHMSLERFEAILSNIVATGLVRRECNHLLVWTGPTLPGEQSKQHTNTTTPIANNMKVTIALGSTTQSIKAAHPVPRSATHFRFTEKGRKPVVDKITNLDTLAGCEGKLEYGNANLPRTGTLRQDYRVYRDRRAQTRACRRNPESAGRGGDARAGSIC